MNPSSKSVISSVPVLRAKVVISAIKNNISTGKIREIFRTYM